MKCFQSQASCLFFLFHVLCFNCKFKSWKCYSEEQNSLVQFAVITRRFPTSKHWVWWEMSVWKSHVLSKTPLCGETHVTPCCLTGGWTQTMKAEPVALDSDAKQWSTSTPFKRQVAPWKLELFEVFCVASGLFTGFVRPLRWFSTRREMLHKWGITRPGLSSYLKCCQGQEIQHIFISKLGCRSQTQSKLLLEMLNSFSTWPASQDLLY